MPRRARSAPELARAPAPAGSARSRSGPEVGPRRRAAGRRDCSAEHRPQGPEPPRAAARPRRRVPEPGSAQWSAQALHPGRRPRERMAGRGVRRGRPGQYPACVVRAPRRAAGQPRPAALRSAPKAAPAGSERGGAAARPLRAAGSDVAELRRAAARRPAAAPDGAALPEGPRRAARDAARQPEGSWPAAARFAPAVLYAAAELPAAGPDAQARRPAEGRAGPAVLHAAEPRRGEAHAAERRRAEPRDQEPPDHLGVAAGPSAAASPPACRPARPRRPAPAPSAAARFARATAALRIGPRSGRWWQAARREV